MLKIPRKCAEEYCMGDQHNDRRKFTRVEKPNLVKIWSADQADPVTAVVEDVSVGGMCVSAAQAYPVGDNLRIRSGKGIRNGIVRHCRVRPQDAHFAIGIEFAAE